MPAAGTGYRQQEPVKGLPYTVLKKIIQFNYIQDYRKVTQGIIFIKKIKKRMYRVNCVNCLK